MSKKKAPAADAADTQCDCQCDCTEEIEDVNNKYLRALADYQNLEKRMENAVEQARTQTRRDSIGRFIDILDDLEKARVFVEDAGLKMVMEKFTSILAESGVAEMDLVGKEYDPYIAEAVEVVEAKNAKEDNIIVEVVQKGYTLGDDIIRPARVKVSKITH